MTPTSNFRQQVAVLPLLLILSLPAAHAGDGHDHGDAKPAVTSPASPRFATHSELFDVVGVLTRQELVVYLDRNASNEPVAGASVEIESGSVKQIGKFEPALGEYHFDGRAFARLGDHPITITVKAGADSDLLAADLHVHGDTATATHTHGWQEYAVWAGGALTALVALSLAGRAVLARRRGYARLHGGKA